MPTNFDPYWEWLKIPSNEQPPDHYRLLGLKRGESNQVAINAAVERLLERMQRLSHGQHVDSAQKILNQVAQARLCLGDDQRKQQYDHQLLERASVKAVSPDAEKAPAATSSPRPQPPSPAQSPSSAKAQASPQPASAARPVSRNLSQPRAKQDSVTMASLSPDTAVSERIKRMKVATAAILVLGMLSGTFLVGYLFGGSNRSPALAQNSATQLTNERSTKVPARNSRSSSNTSTPKGNVTPARTALRGSSSRNSDPPVAAPAPGTQSLSDAISQLPGFPQTGVAVGFDPAHQASSEAATPATIPAAVAATSANANSFQQPSLLPEKPTSDPNQAASRAATNQPVPEAGKEASSATAQPPQSATAPHPVPGQPGVYLPGNPQLFAAMHNEIVGLEGTVADTRTSKSEKTVYLMFTKRRNELIEVRASASDISLESISSLVGKKIRVRAPLKKEFGSNTLGLEIVTLDQIEILPN